METAKIGKNLIVKENDIKTILDRKANINIQTPIAQDNTKVLATLNTNQ